MGFWGGVYVDIYVDGVLYDMDMPSVGYDNSGNGYPIPAKGGFSVALNPYVTHTVYCAAGACPLAIFMSWK